MVYNDFCFNKSSSDDEDSSLPGTVKRVGDSASPIGKDGRGRSLQSFWAENSKPGRVTHVMVFRVAGILSLS